MISKDYGQVTVEMAENPQDTIEYYAVNEIQGVPLVVKEDKEDD